MQSDRTGFFPFTFPLLSTPCDKVPFHICQILLEAPSVELSSELAFTEWPFNVLDDFEQDSMSVTH